MRNVITLDAPPVSRREILRYMGAAASDEATEALIDRGLELLTDKLRYSVCYREAEVLRQGDEILLDGMSLPSETVKKALAGCDRAVIFAATVGLAPDRLMLTYGTLEPSLALCLQAIGAERIEALCDAFCATYPDGRPRISPGYGDFPLATQRDLFSRLDCPRAIGLTLNENLLMTPTKSVTAVFGRKESHEAT